MFNGENERCLSSVKTIKQLIWLSTLGINHSTTSYDPIRPERFGAASSMIVFLDSSSFSRREQRVANQIDELFLAQLPGRVGFGTIRLSMLQTPPIEKCAR